MPHNCTARVTARATSQRSVAPVALAVAVAVAVVAVAMLTATVAMAGGLRCAGFEVLNGTCQPGGTYTHVPHAKAPTPSACCLACESDTHCTHWTYNTATYTTAGTAETAETAGTGGAPCTLKQGRPAQPLASPNCTSGVRPVSSEPAFPAFVHSIHTSF